MTAAGDAEALRLEGRALLEQAQALRDAAAHARACGAVDQAAKLVRLACEAGAAGSRAIDAARAARGAR